MRPSLIHLLPLLLAFFLLATPGAAGEQNLRHISHYSHELGRHNLYGVYVPPDAEPDETFATLFVLHGAYGGYSNWFEVTSILELAKAFRMILVFPDGGQFGWYVNSTQEENAAMATYITRELVAEVDLLFPTAGTPESRGIMGLSMGGHGALLLAAKNPDVFTSASSTSGILNITNHADKWHIADRLGPLEDNVEVWKENSVHFNAELFRDFPHPIMFDCGDHDIVTGATQDNRAFHAHLQKLGIPHIYRELPGGHTWDYWGDNVESHLNFHMGNLLDSSTGMTGMHAHYYRRIAQFHRENAEATINPREGTVVALLGASSFEGFPDRFLPDYTIVNRGIASDTIGLGRRGLSHRLADAVFDVPADVFIVKTGRNDLGNRHRLGGSPTFGEIVEHYDGVLKEIRRMHPDAKIICVSSFPTRGRYEHLADDIPEFNVELRKMVEANEAKFIDMWSLLVEEEEDSNLFREEYTTDGLHLSMVARELWGQQMDAAIKALLAEQEQPEEEPEEEPETESVGDDSIEVPAQEPAPQ